MIIKLIIPVSNTEDGKFSYNGNLSREDYSRMVLDNFWENNDAVTEFTENLMNGVSTVRRRGGNGRDVADNFSLSTAEAFVQNIKHEEIFEDFFEEFSNNGNKTVVLVNINPNSIEGDAMSEMKYWVEDSSRVIDDTELDNKTKILSLPKTFFYVETNTEKYLLENAKMIKNYSDKKFPMYYAILVEKITKINNK